MGYKESAFGKGVIFAAIDALSNVKVDATGVGALYSLRLGERYHKTFRKTFQKLILENLNAPKDLPLHVYDKSMNETLDPEGPDLSALTFNEYP